MEHAVNRAGRQRMLSQCIVKSYLQLVGDIDSSAARGELADSLWLFEEARQSLEPLASEDGLRAAFAEIDAWWAACRSLAIASPSREGAQPLRLAAEQLLRACETATGLIATRAATEAARLVNLAGRQRMLAQRIAKNELLLAGKFPDGSPARELNEALTTFGSALVVLRGLPNGTTEVRSELTNVETLWRALGRLRRDNASLKGVLAATASIAARMERVTTLLAQAH